MLATEPNELSFLMVQGENWFPQFPLGLPHTCMCITHPAQNKTISIACQKCDRHPHPAFPFLKFQLVTQHQLCSENLPWKIPEINNSYILKSILVLNPVMKLQDLFFFFFSDTKISSFFWTAGHKVMTTQNYVTCLHNHLVWAPHPGILSAHTVERGGQCNEMQKERQTFKGLWMTAYFYCPSYFSCCCDKYHGQKCGEEPVYLAYIW